jgi:MFS transporter, SHS family, lactate transporter
MASAYVVPIWGWRGLFVLAAIPALLVLPIRFWVPESPEWQKGKANREKSQGLRDMLAPGLPSKILWASFGMALGFGVYYAMSGLYPTMLIKEHAQTTGQVAMLVGLFNIGMLVGAVVAGWVATRFGVLSAIVVPASLSILVMPLYVGFVPSQLMLGSFLGAALGVGFCGIVPVFLTGLFPPEVRARAVGLVYHLGAFGAAFVPTSIAALSEYAGLSLAASIALLAGAAELALVVLMVWKRRDLLDSSAPATEAKSVAA